MGADSSGLDAGAVVPLANARMLDSSFTTLLGGSFAWWSGIAAQVNAHHSAEYAGYSALYGSYSYPILPVLCGEVGSTTYTVNFAGARYSPSPPTAPPRAPPRWRQAAP